MTTGCKKMPSGSAGQVNRLVRPGRCRHGGQGMGPAHWGQALNEGTTASAAAANGTNGRGQPCYVTLRLSKVAESAGLYVRYPSFYWVKMISSRPHEAHLWAPVYDIWFNTRDPLFFLNPGLLRSHSEGPSVGPHSQWASQASGV